MEIQCSADTFANLIGVGPVAALFTGVAVAEFLDHGPNLIVKKLYAYSTPDVVYVIEPGYPLALITAALTGLTTGITAVDHIESR